MCMTNGTRTGANRPHGRTAGDEHVEYADGDNESISIWVRGTFHGQLSTVARSPNRYFPRSGRNFADDEEQYEHRCQCSMPSAIAGAHRRGWDRFVIRLDDSSRPNAMAMKIASFLRTATGRYRRPHRGTEAGMSMIAMPTPRQRDDSEQMIPDALCIEVTEPPARIKIRVE